MSIDPYAGDLPPAHREGRLGVGVISAGRVGAVLGAALRAAGHQIIGVHAVSEASRDRAEHLLAGAPVMDIPDILARAELILLAVPDDALPEVVEGAAQAGHFQPGQLVIHTSGRHGVTVLEPAAAAGAVTAAIHPVMTFTGMSVDLERLFSCAFGITAAPEILPVAQALAVEMGGEPVEIPETQRGLYHAALAHAGNHLTVLTAQSTQLLHHAGVEDPSRVLGPLVQASLDNALASGVSALTGPVARGDVTTVQEHLQVLRQPHLPADVPVAYEAMAQAATQRAVERGLISEAVAAEFLDLLTTSGG